MFVCGVWCPSDYQRPTIALGFGTRLLAEDHLPFRLPRDQRPELRAVSRNFEEGIDGSNSKDLAY